LKNVSGSKCALLVSIPSFKSFSYSLSTKSDMPATSIPRSRMIHWIYLIKYIIFFAINVNLKS
jgi:hypothetical protein